MKYLIFAFDRFYPNGGIRDLRQAVADLKEVNVDELIGDFDNVQIVDYATLSVLYEHDYYDKCDNDQLNTDLIEFINGI